VKRLHGPPGEFAERVEGVLNDRGLERGATEGAQRRAVRTHQELGARRLRRSLGRGDHGSEDDRGTLPAGLQHFACNFAGEVVHAIKMPWNRGREQGTENSCQLSVLSSQLSVVRCRPRTKGPNGGGPSVSA